MINNISSTVKVITDSVLNESNEVIFSNIKVTQNTNVNFLGVSIDIFKKIETKSIVIVNQKEEEITNVDYIKIRTLTDYYSKESVNELVFQKLKEKPDNVINYCEVNDYLYWQIAKDIIIKNSYLGLTENQLKFN